MRKGIEDKHLRRRQLDRLFRSPIRLADIPKFKQGYIQEIRKALGISTRQLARLLGVNQSTIVRFEEAEQAGTISINSLMKLADILHCKLVYAVVPYDSLDAFLKQRAQDLARDLIKKARHSMPFENQNVSGTERQQQIDRIALRIVRALDRSLWKS